MMPPHCRGHWHRAKDSDSAREHRGYIGRETSGLLRVSAYILPAASRDAARRAWGNPSCYSGSVSESGCKFNAGLAGPGLISMFRVQPVSGEALLASEKRR
jgi:hypothetical protein